MRNPIFILTSLLFAFLSSCEHPEFLYENELAYPGGKEVLTKISPLGDIEKKTGLFEPG